MKTINKITLSCLLMFVAAPLFAQQDEQSSMYMFNPLHFNPAYAGTRGDISVVGVFRSQWVGVKGAPVSQFVSAHSPLSAKNMAAGINLSNDKIGARNRTSFFGNYAYTLRFKNNTKLNLGVSAGGDFMASDYAKLIAKDPTEAEVNTNFSQTSFNIGTGAYYYGEKFYVGLSSPRVLETKLQNDNIVLSQTYTKRHFFLAAGYVYEINTLLDLKPSLLLKMTPNAPITMDVNLNAFYAKKYWAGIMYRFNESIGVNLAYQIKESFMFGYAYDFPINGLNTVKNGGSHEIMLTYDFNKNKAYASPRYF
jgi:type IX secretion system PorP/SprF family membrane protein